MKTLLLIDGNAIMHRAFHALPPFKTSEGIPTNIIYGFLSMLYRVSVDFKPDYIITCFDTPAPTFRNKLYKKYQSQRPKIDDDFITQIPLVKDALDAGGIYHLEKDGFEADDLLGTIAKNFASKDMRVLILSGDKDIMQMVNENIYLASPQLGLSNIKIYDKVEVERKLGVSPQQIIDYKALAGDPSDNYPGARGIGPKTASNLLLQFKTVDNLLNNINSIKSAKVKEIIINNEENIRLSKKLATIKTDVDVNIDLKKSEFNGFNNNLKNFLFKYQINSLIKRLFNERSKETKKTSEKPKADQIGMF